VTAIPTTVVGGDPTNGTVNLSAAAPTGGMVINLTTNNSSAITIPASVKVPAGRAAQSFLITTKVVSSTGTVTITASQSGTSVTRSTTLTVTQSPAAPSLTNFTLSPTSVVGGTSTTGVVTLSGAAPSGGTVVMLSSPNSATVPISQNVTVPAGSNSA